MTEGVNRVLGKVKEEIKRECEACEVGMGRKQMEHEAWMLALDKEME